MALKVRDILRARKEMRRLGHILRVLARHGFGHLAHRISALHFLSSRLEAQAPKLDRPASRAMQKLTTPERLRVVLEDLGPTFVKLGQMLATRADRVPERYLKELRKLTEDVPPFDTRVARRIVEEQLGEPISEVFQEFGDKPIASGSIGQVHAAVLRSGEAVVVKVKRPNIEKTIRADLDLLEFLAPQAEQLEELKPFRPVMLIDEFGRSLRREMDFVSEASFTTKIGEHLASNPRILVPKVHWDFTGANVLVMERLEGISLNQQDAIAKLSADKKQVARDLAEAFFQQFFKTGLFHADPHPGNILLKEDGRICLVDFGMVGRLDTHLRHCLGTSLIALVQHDLDVITDVFMEIGAITDETDVERLKADLVELLDKYYGIPMSSLDVDRCFTEVMRVARSHQLILPRNFVLLGKSFVTMVMMARELDPSFDIAEVTKPYARSLLMEKFSPENLKHGLLSGLWNVSQSLRHLPREMRGFMRKLLEGKLTFTHRFPGIGSLAKEADRATNRLSFSIIVSAIVIGSSLLLHARVPPHLNHILPGVEFVKKYMDKISVLGLAGFLLAGILGLWLVIAIWRRGRL